MSPVNYVSDGDLATPANVNRWLNEAGGEIFNVKSFGAVGDGVTDDTAAIQAAIVAAVAADTSVKITQPHAVTALTPPAGARILFEGFGRLIALDASTVITPAGDDVVIVNPEIDLGGVSNRAYFGDSRTGLRVLGTTRIYNPFTTASDPGSTRGGLIFNACTDFVVGDVIAEGLYQYDNQANGRYRAVGAVGCSDFSISSITVFGGDQAFVPFDSTNWHVGSIFAHDLTDNVLYAQGTTSHGEIGEVVGHNVAEGIVLNCSGNDANLHIGSALIRVASVRGLSLRTGGGYHIGSITLVDAQFAQSTSYAGASRLTIGTCRVTFVANTTLRPVLLTRNTDLSIGVLEVYADTPFGDEAIRFVDCNRVTIGHLNIDGIGGSPIATGLRFSNGADVVSNPSFVIGLLTSRNVTTPYIVNTDKPNVVLGLPQERVSNLTLRQDGPVTLQLRRTTTSLTAGDVLGAIEAYNSDTSGAAVRFRLEVQAAGGSGQFGQTVIYNDRNEVVGRIPTNQGLGIRLPTSSAGLESGMIWNNAGSVEIVV
jgi:hypothetical protein